MTRLPTSFRFAEDTLEKLDSLAQKNGLSRTGVLEVLIRNGDRFFDAPLSPPQKKSRKKPGKGIES